MNEKIEKLQKIVEIEVASFCKVLKLSPHSFGVENCVFKAQTIEWGEIAIKVPWNRYEKNDIDGAINSLDGLQKEYLLTKHCMKYGIPVPKVFKLHKGINIDFIVQEFMHSENKGDFPFEDLGRLTYSIHQLSDLPDLYPIDINFVIAQRIIERTKAIERITNEKILFPSSEVIEQVLKSFPSKNKLLHMDIRPANTIHTGSQIRAIFDWTNALIGDPVFELMRIKDYGHLTEDFITGYKDFNKEMNRVPKIVKWLYQYDTAVMLSILFLTEVKDKKQGNEAQNRMKRLHEKISKEL
ncbi:phosphotransferase [Neobacillus sp. YIM B06451]|uniref:phosphotransferase family protein n=1 Tax=Neobacillus sp. YIM B06451 TaxID=3070994 RepID=UPI00292E3775|nr:phosphotransferase [Neobacillus sp. YIM B06451]